DGYVPGSFVLELKGCVNDWLRGFFQGLAYKNQGLDFSQIIVAARGFLAIWRVNDLDEALREEVLHAHGAPHDIGVTFARKHKGEARNILKGAIWNGGMELSGALFLQHTELATEQLRSFEKTIREGRKVRLRITPRNFVAVLKEMKDFFDPTQPVKTARAFCNMVYGWNDGATVKLSEKNEDQATIGGETITDLVPSKRRLFKDYVENRFIYLNDGEHTDDFFARYDEALDAVDKQFRIKNGIFFTDRDLSKFVMWLVKQHVPNLGRNYLVLDPACGSGNLVTNWRSPLELRHKVVSEIEPELLFAVERRMQGDHWHQGKFTVVPKVSEGTGLNFLDKSAEEYLDEIRAYLAEKGQRPDKPIAFLCNPPYRSDDDQGAKAIDYKIHESITHVTGMDASSERYCCFLAQMKLICEAARDSGLPDHSLLLLFTKSTWLTRRPMFEGIRAQMLEAFDNVTGILVKGKEFFDVKGSWPVAFSLWRYRNKGERARLDKNRSIPLLDLTWLTKKQLAQVPWDNPKEMQRACEPILQQSDEVEIGVERTSIREWSGQSMTDFKRDRRRDEKNAKVVGGLPLGDGRQNNRKAYGDADGRFIGFMDELTPCRVKRSTPDKPWLYLDTRFMSIKKARCLSGPPTHLGYCASNLDSAKKLFFWYALARTFLQTTYPMWIDADNMWEPVIPCKLEKTTFQIAFAIGYAENECVETRFPANNPVRGALELNVSNPLTPLNSDSFWSGVMNPFCSDNPSASVLALTKAVDKLFADWKKLFRNRPELALSRRPYMLDNQGPRLGAGIQQVRDYANEAGDETLKADWAAIQKTLSLAKKDFFELVSSRDGLNYFGVQKKRVTSASLGLLEPSGTSEL
ncbi:MAG: hypothetical protein WBX38_08545, partial [Candidatus Sulfotelmatobacter sp.]